MRNELEKEIKKLVSNIKRRIKRVVKKYGQTPGTRRALKNGTLNAKVKKLNETQLKEKLRELKYINSLKTTRVKESGYYTKTFKAIEDFLKDNPGYSDKFWEIYNKLVEEKRIQNYYKYDVMDIISQSLSYGTTDYEDIAKAIDDALANESNEDEEGDDDYEEGDEW